MSTIRQKIGRAAARKVRDAVGNKRKKTLWNHVEKVQQSDDGLVRFAGFANVGTVDRVGDVVDPGALKGSLKSYLRYGRQLFLQHVWEIQVGEVTHAEVVSPGSGKAFKASDPLIAKYGGLYIEGFVDKNESPETGQPISHPLAEAIDFARMQVLKGRLKNISIGFMPIESKKGKGFDPIKGKDVEANIITRGELLENSLVTLPASREANIELQKALQSFYGDEVAQKLFDNPNELPEEIEGFDVGTLRKIFQSIPARKISAVNAEPEADPSYEVVSLSDDEERTASDGYEIVSLETGERTQ